MADGAIDVRVTETDAIASTFHSVRGLSRWYSWQEMGEAVVPNVCGSVNTCMSIAIVRSNHLYLRGSRILTGQMSNRRPRWEDKAGLSLIRH